MKRANLTDRAKRYRAQHNKPAGPRRCNFCSSRRNVDIDHITGDESDGDPEDLIFLCRPCNAAKAVQQARNRIGVRTRQYNPARRITYSAYRHAAAILTGKTAGDVAAATAYIRATPAAKRLEFSARTAKNPPPTFEQYVYGLKHHTEKAHDEGGKIIHATPPALRSQYAAKIAEIKRARRGEVPF